MFYVVIQHEESVLSLQAHNDQQPEENFEKKITGSNAIIAIGLVKGPCKTICRAVFLRPLI